MVFYRAFEAVRSLTRSGLSKKYDDERAAHRPQINLEDGRLVDGGSTWTTRRLRKFWQAIGDSLDDPIVKEERREIKREQKRAQEAVQLSRHSHYGSLESQISEKHSGKVLSPRIVTRSTDKIDARKMAQF